MIGTTEMKICTIGGNVKSGNFFRMFSVLRTLSMQTFVGFYEIVYLDNHIRKGVVAQ